MDKKTRILLVDDDVDFIDLNKAVLENHGFDVVVAYSGDPIYRSIPILMLTAVAESTGYDFSQELDGYWMKTDDYASKPLLPEDLVKKIDDLIAKSKAEA